MPPPSEKPSRGSHSPPFLLSAGSSLQSLTAGLLSRLPFSPFNPQLAAPANPKPAPPCSSAVTVPLAFPFFSAFSSDRCCQSQGKAPAPAPAPAPSSAAHPAVRSLPSGVTIDGLSSSSNGGGGPAFVGQVFSMLDPSGNGLMAVTTHFDIPFLSKRTPEWLKKMFATITKSERDGPVFRFFIDLNDAVSYVKRLNVPTGMVGACRLDVAYEHFKEKPHMFQFIPNEKQVKEANKLLKVFPQKGGKRKLDGVPVFTAHNLNIAIATKSGIRWYTPYFFDKSLLDNILEASIDQHFRTIIQNRHMHRRRDIIDDSLTAEMIEDSGDSLFEPPEVQEVVDEMGHSGIPLSVISKAAEIQLLDVVDKVLLGNKWLRKATGIQPKFPYLVESFEERSAASFTKASTPASIFSDPEGPGCSQTAYSEAKFNENAPTDNDQLASDTVFQSPFANWLPNLWSGPHEKHRERESKNKSTTRISKDAINEVPLNPLLPKITMVGVSMGENGHMSRATLKKTMEDLTKELEQASQKSTKLDEDKDPLFVANVGDYSSITRISSS